MADERYITEDPELDDGQTADEDGEGAGLYEHFAVVADKGQAPLRLDKFLTVRMEKCSRNRIQAAADSGSILVNGKAAKSSYKVKPLDRIQIVMPYPRREVEIIPENIPQLLDNNICLFSGGREGAVPGCRALRPWRSTCR